MHWIVARIAGLLLIALALTAQPGAVRAAPSITVSPDPAPLGTRVAFWGTGFPADTMLTLTIATDTTPPQVLIAIPVPTDDNGSFGAGLSTPATGNFAAGKHTVTVTGQPGKAPLASASFTLTSAAGAASGAPATIGAAPAAPSVTDTANNGGSMPFAAIVVAVTGILGALILAALVAVRRARARGVER